MTIGRLLSQETLDPKLSTLKMVADHFNISIDYLVEGNVEEGTIMQGLKQNKPHFVPKLDWETAQKIKDVGELNLAKWNEWQSVSEKEQEISKKAFALESRPSMYPRFPQGTVFIIDPDIHPTDGDIVLIKLNSNHELTLRELVIDPPEWQLHSIVNGAAMFHYSATKHQIVGVNIMTMLYNRKEFG